MKRRHELDKKISDLEREKFNLELERDRLIEKMLRPQSGEFTEEQFQGALMEVSGMDSDTAIRRFLQLVKENDDLIEKEEKSRCR